MSYSEKPLLSPSASFASADWSSPTPSTSNVQLQETSRSFYLSRSKPSLFIEAQGGNYDGLVEHRISDHPDLAISCSESKIEVQVTITFSDQRSLKEMKIHHQNDKEKTSDGIVISRKVSLAGSFVHHKQRPFVNVLVLYPHPEQLSCGMGRFTTQSANLSVKSGDLRTLYFDEWIVEAINGTVELQSVTANTYILAKTTNGRLSSKGTLRAPQVNVLSTNGPITLESIVSPDSVYLSNTNGLIKVTSTLKASKLKAESHNSQLDFASASATSTLEIKNNNGDIKIGNARSPSFVISSSNGSIDGAFETSGSMKMKTTNGAIHAKVQVLEPRNKGDAVSIKINTNSGNIESELSSQSPSTVLKGLFESVLGSVSVKHKDYSGSFAAESKGGKLDLVGSYELDKENKVGHAGKSVEGRIGPKETGPRSHSQALSKNGPVTLQFD